MSNQRRRSCSTSTRTSRFLKVIVAFANAQRNGLLLDKEAALFLRLFCNGNKKLPW